MTLLLVIILSITAIIAAIHKITENKKDGFSKFINTIWFEYFEDQTKAIISFMVVLIICIIISFMFKWT